MIRNRVSRRRFLHDSASFGASLALAGAAATQEKKAGPNERLSLGIIGVAGQGALNLAGVDSENIVALCDVDTNRAGKARAQYPNAWFYQDFRKLLDQKNIDAVVISTPDHMHAIPALQAMRSGKHVYCEKCLAYSIEEVRAMMETAVKHKIVTQMGTQIHALDNYRRVVEIVQAGVIGPIERVHVWCDKRPRLVHKAKEPLPVPAGLDYDLWVGPATFRPYDPAHTHFTWRWWWEFGGGILSDMGCHYMDLPFWALDLAAPTTVRATPKKGSAGDYDVPDVMSVDYQFPVRGSRPAVHLTWYSGVTGPDLSETIRYQGYPSGVLLEGTKGKLLADFRRHKLLPEDQYKDFTPPKPTIPSSPGHYVEWIEAVKHGKATTCNFAYSGVLTEAVLLGNVAFRCGESIEWDGQAGRVTNTKAADQYLRREYRKGWSL